MPPCNRQKKVGPGNRHQGCARTWLRPQPGWAPLATTFAWSVVLWALILLVVTDGSSSSFVGFSLLELVCVFSKYEFLHCAFLVSFALFHVSYLKIAYIPKLVERLDQSPIFYLFLFIKRYLFLYNKRRQQLPHTWSFARPRVKALRTKWVHHPCQRACIQVIPSFTWVCELQSVYHINLW
jgi:hypothetical protein